MNARNCGNSAPEPDLAAPGRGRRLFGTRRSGDGKPKMQRAHRLAALPWRLGSVLAAVLAAVAGWLVVLAYCSLAWLSTGAQGGFELVLSFATRAWLLANGVPLVVDGVAVSLVPVGFTALIVVIVCSLTSAIAQGTGHSSERHSRARGAGGRRDGAGPASPGSQLSSGALTLRLVGWFATSYTVILVLSVNLLGRPEDTGRAIIGGLLIAGVFGLLAAGRTLHWRLVRLDHGGWASGLAAGVCASFAALVLASALLLGTALLHNHRSVLELHEQLGAGLFGGLLFSLAQVMWLPNAVLWAAAWLLGAGFTLSTTTVFSPAFNQPGVLPAIPLFGVAPAGGGSAVALFWLLVPALAGAVGGVVAVRARRDEASRRLPPAEFGEDAAALLGLVVGVCTAALLCLVQVLGRGDLGVTQLMNLGARMPQLLVLAPAVLGAGGMVGGWLCAVADRTGDRLDAEAGARGSPRS